MVLRFREYAFTEMAKYLNASRILRCKANSWGFPLKLPCNTLALFFHIR